ncbi:TPA: P2 family phage major capsid protein [Raoultella ornithinolytica]
MTPKAEALIRKYVAGLATSYGVPDTSRFFALTDPRDIQLRNALLQQSEFLQLINAQTVEQVQGQVVATGNPGLFTGRKKDGRFSRKMGNSGNEYKLAETDSGSYLDYATLVTWANAGSEDEFFQRIQAFSNESFALDILRIAFNGTHVAEDNADYTDTPIPHFTHSGSGYQLLANLGRAFSISDYTWFQLPDGTIYAGSYAHSRFADAPVEIPIEFIQSAAAGNSITLPVIPAIRPGVVVNGQRITQVRIQDDEMTLTWTPLNSEGKPAQKSPEQRQIDKIYPELSAGLHLPRLARVMGPSDSAALGDQADPFRPRYAVNLQLLDENGEAARNTPVYSAVPLPVPMAGAEGGLFQYPPEGALVEIGFADGRPDKPLIRQTLPEGQALPDIKPGEQLQQQRAGVSQRVTQAGSWQRETDQAIEETSSLRKVSSEQESRTVTERTTVVKANDTATVLGTAKLMAGAVVQLADGDYTAGATGNIVSHCGKDRSASVGQNDNLAVGGSLTEKIQGIRRSVAAAQELLAPSIWLGSEEVNVLSLLTDTLDVLRQLAEQTAQHTHSNTDKPINSQAIADAAAKTEELNKKYAPFIS